MGEKCPRCGQDATLLMLALGRFKPLIAGHQTLEENMERPGFMLDLRTLFDALTEGPARDR